MSLLDLYQEVILDHNKSPRNYGSITNPSCSAKGHNPLCGDELYFTVTLDGNNITDIKFSGKGCAICMASASILTTQVIDISINEALELFKKVKDMLTSGDKSDSLGKLEILANVSQYPARVKCASLAWHTLHAALANSNDAVTTE